MNTKTGFQTITYKFALVCRDEKLLGNTKHIYNDVLRFYYQILLDNPMLSEVPKQKRLRELEKMTVGERGVSKVELQYPIPYKKVPLYLRRAAINDAIRLYSSYVSSGEGKAKPAQNIDAPPVLYKGMYKDFDENGITIKLFDGERWIWERCSIDMCGRTFPEVDSMLSPTLVHNARKSMLHVPVVRNIDDVRSVKEWMKTDELICSAFFPGKGSLAVLAVINSKRELVECKFIHGLDELTAKRKKLIGRMQKSRESMGGDLSKLPTDENKRLKQSIHNLTEDAAHKTSHEIIDFCVKRNIHVLVVPGYRYVLDMNSIKYLPTSNFDWIGRRIISQLKYKAFGQGLVVTTVSNANIAFTCHSCGERIKKYNEGRTPSEHYYGGKLFICPNGHKGNSYLNSALNVGFKFIETQQKCIE